MLALTDSLCCWQTSGANLYGGRDQEYDGVMDPTADFSANRRMRMNPRAFSRLSSASRVSEHNSRYTCGKQKGRNVGPGAE